MAWWAAAAVIMFVLALVPLLQPEKKPVVQKQLVVEDTYDDPQQALGCDTEALFTASVKMNKGLHPLK